VREEGLLSVSTKDNDATSKQ